MAEFDINEALKLYLNDPTTIPTPEASADVADIDNDPESITPAALSSILNPISSAIFHHQRKLLVAARHINLNVVEQAITYHEVGRCGTNEFRTVYYQPIHCCLMTDKEKTRQ